MILQPYRDHRSYEARFPISEEFKDERNTHLKVDVSYVLGGANLFTGGQNARGYRLGFRRVQVSENCESFMLFGDNKLDSGYIMLEVADRFQAKKLKQWVDKAEPVLDELVRKILSRQKEAVVETVLSIGGCVNIHKPEPAPEPTRKSLLTEGLKAELRAAPVNSQKAICKFFNPAGNGTWIISSMDADGDTLWCLADLGMDCCEQGTVSLKELEETKLPMGLRIERDLHFRPQGRTLSNFQRAYEDKGTLTGVS